MNPGTPGGTSRSLSPIAGTAGTGLNNARAGANQAKPHPYSPSAAQTPKEALTYLDLLYKTGRMQEVAAILRRSEVFREAWLILQRSFVTSPETSEKRGPAKRKGAAEPLCISAPKTPPGFVPAGQPTCSLAAALEIYRSQLRYYDQETNAKYRLSLRV